MKKKNARNAIVSRKDVDLGAVHGGMRYTDKDRESTNVEDRRPRSYGGPVADEDWVREQRGYGRDVTLPLPPLPTDQNRDRNQDRNAPQRFMSDWTNEGPSGDAAPSAANEDPWGAWGGAADPVSGEAPMFDQSRDAYSAAYDNASFDIPDLPSYDVSSFGQSASHDAYTPNAGASSSYEPSSYDASSYDASSYSSYESSPADSYESSSVGASSSYEPSSYDASSSASHEQPEEQV